MPELQDRLQAGHVTFLLGAGFAKHLEPRMPLMNGLSEAVRERLSLDETRIIHAYASKLLQTDIEAAMTWLATEWAWDGPATLAEKSAVYHAIVALIDQTIGRICDAHAAPEESDGVRLLSLLYKTDALITTNYDTLLEKALVTLWSSLQHRSELQGDRGLRWGRNQAWSIPFGAFREIYQAPIGNIQHRRGGTWTMVEELGAAPILKLHGSINWFKEVKGARPAFFFKDPSYRLPPQDPDRLGLETSIIPPILEKSSMTNNYLNAQIWQNAMEKLAHSRTLFVVGYSMPPTDLAIVHLLRHGFVYGIANPDPPKKVFVINKCPAREQEELKERYLRVFGADVVDFQFVMEDSPMPAVMRILQEARGTPPWFR